MSVFDLDDPLRERPFEEDNSADSEASTVSLDYNPVAGPSSESLGSTIVQPTQNDATSETDDSLPLLFDSRFDDLIEDVGNVLLKMISITGVIPNRLPHTSEFMTVESRISTYPSILPVNLPNRQLLAEAGFVYRRKFIEINPKRLQFVLIILPFRGA
jgi:hypothetical protein